ncbi:MAG: right-handed parallel beta-helix repeat-containing protein, partial [Planctomycetota bacterium]
MCRNRQVRASIGLLAAIAFAPAVGSAQPVLYVDDSATGANDGSSWCDAYWYLQDALAAARASGGAVTEIRVAQGTYKPDQGVNQTPGDRTASFELVNGVAIRGGYAGCGAADPNARDIPVYETILSGDLKNDDTLPKSTSGSDCCAENRTPGCDDAVCEQIVCGVYAACCTNSTWSKFCADAAAYLCCNLCSDANNCDNSYHVVTSVATDVTAILDGFTITGGHANVLGAGDNDSGAGMINFGGSPTLRNCTFRENVSRVGYYYLGGGGGIYSLPPGHPTFTTCTFRGNTTDQSGGGVYGTGTFVNCVFIGNAAEYGGGIDGGSAFTNCKFLGNSARWGGGLVAGGTLVNCLFSGNTAYWGGAVYTYISSPSFTNCTFSGNTAELGGGLFSDEAGEQLANCILWGNADGGGMCESAQFQQGVNSRPSINYSSVQGWTGAFGGVGNIGDAPAFINANGSDDVFGTEDDNVGLMVTSPCINAGDNTALPSDTYDLDQDGDTSEQIPLDLGGDPRVVDGAVNMGAYEGPHQHFILDTDSVVVVEGGTATFSVRLALDPLGTVDAMITPLQGDPDIFVLSGAVLSFNSGNYSIEQTVTLGAAEDVDLFNGTRAIGVNAPGIDLLDLVATESDNEPVPTVMFVDWRAWEGLNIGTSWRDAFTKLGDALALASSRPGASEIWVARGTYAPAQRDGDRSATFRLVEGVAVYGGFAGGENTREERDPIGNVTVLSGDLKGDDEPNFVKIQDNSYHVVTSLDTTATTVLDGFTISGGHANVLGNNDSGAGLINLGGSPVFSNLVFRSNRAISCGGGMYTARGDPPLSDCTFIGNLAEGIQAGGGGLYNQDGSPTLTRCLFSGNSSYLDGGGMYTSGDPTLTDCVFESNVPGGLVQRGSGSATLTNCVFIGNIGRGLDVRQSTIVNCRFLGNSGGGAGVFYGNPTFVNCLFAGNSAGGGGGLYNLGSSPTLVNCVFNGNAATLGSGIHNFLGSRPEITNCIIWGDSSPIYSDTSSTPNLPVVNYSCIQGGWTGAGGIGNVSADPLFVDANGSDGMAGTLDDNLRLSPGSPCIDAGANASVPADSLDFDNDGNATEPIPFDFDGRWRFRDDPLTSDTGAGNPPVVDMGAFEFQPPCESDDDCWNVLFCDGIERCVDGSCEAGVDPCVGRLCDEMSNSCVDCRSSADCSDGDHCNGVEICEAGGICGMRMLVDCNGNAVEDLCDIQEARSEDRNGNNIPDECEPPLIVWNADVLSPDRATRSLGFRVEAAVTATASAGQNAIKVTMVELQNPVPPNAGCCPPQDFHTYESATCTAARETGGCVRWVGEPGTFYEAQGPPLSGPYRAARLQCSPFYADWVGETASGPVTVVGAEIMPSSEYSVQTYAASCTGNEDTCTNVSAAVPMYTRRSGDAETGYNPPGTGQQPDAGDVTALVNKFKKMAGAPLNFRSQLQPNLPELNTDVSASDIVAVVDAY